MAIEIAGQRRFATMGTTTFKILDKLSTNQRLCRLLKYQVKDPFSTQYPDVNGEDLIGKQICVVPKIFDDSTEKMSYVIAVFDSFVVNSMNSEFKLTTVRFDIACPFNEWVLGEDSLRPYLLMQEIDTMFNQCKLTGIGNLEFYRCDILTLSPQIGGFTMQYKINEFN